MQAFSRTKEGQEVFQQIALWSLKECALEKQRNSTAERLPSSETLAWICWCIEQGCSLSLPAEEAAMKVCREILSWQQLSWSDNAVRQNCRRATIIVILLILHPLFAHFFYGTESPSLEQPASPESAISNSALGEPHAGALSGQASLVKSASAAAEQMDYKLSRSDTESSLVKTISSSMWKESSLWVFLLGNTLPRLLDLIDLPRLGASDWHWPSSR